MPVLIRGVYYDTPDQAAKAMNVNRGAVYQALHRGKPDSIGIPRGTKPGELGRYRKPFRFGKHQWPSISHAAEELGINRKRLSLLIRAGEFAPITVAIMRIEAKKADALAKEIQMQGDKYLQIGKNY